MTGFNWRTVTPSREPSFMVRGTELSVAIVPGFNSRFQLCEIRTVSRGDDGMEYDREYVVRDADTVTDADVREKIRPKIIGKFPTLDAALEAIEPHRPT